MINKYSDIPGQFYFKDVLSGEKAFYRQDGYNRICKEEAKTILTTPSFICVFENKVVRIAKFILSVMIFPIGIYQCLHVLAGRKIVQSSSRTDLDSCRRLNMDPTGEWKYKRIMVKVDGLAVDGYIVGTQETLGNGRWMLRSCGNYESCEDNLLCRHSNKFKLLKKLNTNMLIFNYPGVGASSGSPTRQAVVKAYLAMLTFLEDEKRGIGAKEIIGYGYSLGGNVQGEALNIHKLKERIKYVFVKDRTFSYLSTTVFDLYSKISSVVATVLSNLIIALGYNMNSVESSMKLQAPEILIQTVKGSTGIIEHSEYIVDDGVISAKASLAKSLLDDPRGHGENKIFIGIQGLHRDPLKRETIDFLADSIEKCLKLDEKRCSG